MAWVWGGIAGVSAFCLALQLYGAVLPLAVPGYAALHRDFGLIVDGLQRGAAAVAGAIIADMVYRVMAQARSR